MRTTLAIIALVTVVTLVVMAMTGRSLPVPAAIVARIEARANLLLDGHARVRVGGAEAIVGSDFIPRVRLTGVELYNATGLKIADLPDLRASFWPGPMLRGQIVPRSIRVDRARIALNRSADGSLSLDAPAALPAAGSGNSLADVLDTLERTFALPGLNRLERIDVTRLAFRFADARSGQVWTVEDGALKLQQNDEALAIDVGFDVGTDPGRLPANARIDFVTYKHSPEARVVVEVAGVPSRDLAAQSAALGWLRVIDAPISGTLRTGVEPDGRISELIATLDLGQGALQPTPDTLPVPFKHAGMTLSYDGATRKITFDRIALDSSALRVSAGAQAWLGGDNDGLPGTLLGQVAISDLMADPEGLFAKPVNISRGALDFKVDLDPFRLTVGQLSLVDGPRRISASGRVAATPLGWDVAFDVGIDAIPAERLLALWPVQVVPKTRLWLSENVATADLYDMKAALRLSPGSEPKLALNYAFRDADVRFIRSLPPVNAGAGYATITDNAYTLVLERGHVTAPQGGDLDMTGSVLTVPDIRVVPAPAEITLRTTSSVTSALSILDQPPFRFLTKAGQAVDIADGRARVDARLRLPLVNNVLPGDVRFNVTADLTDVRSDRLVPGRPLAAERLTLTATEDGMRIAGPGTLSGVPFDAYWDQRFGPEAKGRSRVEGELELSQNFLDAFGIALPKGSVRGTGQGRIALDIARDAPVRFRLVSDLAGIALRIPGLAWTKSADRGGKIDISGTLGTPPAIEKLTLSAPGLDAVGSISLRGDGSLDRARFDSVDLDWFKGGLTLRGQGKGAPPAIIIDGGAADLRRTAFAKDAGGPGSLPITVALDRLTVSDGIALTGFRGDFTTRGGFNGTFTGAVNRAAPVAGTVAPLKNGTGVRIRSDDAGAALRAAGIFDRARGGALDLTLRPTGAEGSYDGDFAIRGIRVVNAPVLAEMLGAISVIGLIEQLNGSGILFSDVKGSFLLTPKAVEIRQGSAIGASLGVSGEGLYDSVTKQIDLRGTISPIYLLNGIGAIVSKSRDGLFGFNYRLQGPASDPRISINPLSILTPGMFREIFRAPPPRIKADATPRAAP